MQNEPLLFVQGPPIHIKVLTKFEESTSVFVLNGDEVEEIEEREVVVEVEQGPVVAKKVENIPVLKKITYLNSPFARQVYRPLQFVLDDETITGTIVRVEEKTVLIDIGEGNDEFNSVELDKIVEILWRGNPFIED